MNQNNKTFEENMQRLEQIVVPWSGAMSRWKNP